MTHGDVAWDRVDGLRALESGTTVEAALSFFDVLPSMRVEDMIGSWRGSGIETGNPFDGLLESLGWHGKRFDGPDEAHPLVFDAGSGGLINVNPSFIPLSFVVRRARLVHSPLSAWLFRRLRTLMQTSIPQARLRMTEYRGAVSATMCYDRLPIHDVFRKVDDDTLVGVMDMRGMDSPFMFVLRRETPATTSR
jgi:hypothetical protein